MANLEQKVDFLSMFPVPNGVNQSSTMVADWELGIPQTSYNNGTAQYSVSMVTKICLCSNTKHYWLWTLSTTLNQTIPYYHKMVSMIPIGPPRPSISEYPQIAE